MRAFRGIKKGIGVGRSSLTLGLVLSLILGIISMS